MKRRSLLLGAAASLANPAIGGTTTTLRFVPQSPLASLDPVWTSAMTTRNVGFQVVDVLFGRDAQMNPKSQMLEGYVVEDEGRRWVMTLRPDQWFHDGERVLARDCTASLRRWMKRDPGCATLAARLDALEAPNDRTIVLRLTKKFPALPQLLSKFQTAAIMVPERLAATDPFKQMPETVGSGPFQFLADEYVIGSHAALAPFKRYVPRNDPASFTSGGHRVLVDRMEWKMIPDAATAANALIAGEVEVDRAGMEAVINRPRADEVKEMLAKAGYTGERLVLLHTTDQPFYDAACQVVAAQLNRVGVNIDDQVMDWGTVLQRRASREPLAKGGWSLFVSVTPVPEYRDPLLASLLRGNGKDAWIGWPDIPSIETAYNAWLDTDDAAEQTRLEREIQLAAFDSVPFIPLGRYRPSAAWRSALSHPLKGPAPVFWEISKA
jgi:ABC-type transport system substrate-binding protein